MEDIDQPLDASLGSRPSAQRLRFTESVRSDLLETAKWALFFAVLMFIILGFLAFASLALIVSAGAYGFGMAIVMMGIYGSLIFFPAWYYYKFSTLTRQALNFDDNNALEMGFWYLKRFYKFVGILIIVVISLYLLILIGSLLFVSSSRFPN